MTITLTDRAPLEKVRKLADGRIAAVAKFARTGCQTYAGSEVGRPDMATVTVYRADDEVFSQDAMASFAHQAITLNHPQDGSVSPANWSRTAVGFTEGRVARDGGYVEIPLMLADASAISAYESGSARELSAGYKCELVWGDGVAPDGTRYQARQVAIRGNHIALVPAGRAGTECRIGDSMTTQDARVSAEVSRARMMHDQKFAFMGDRAPKFDEGRAGLLARAALDAHPGKAVRDAALEHRHFLNDAPPRVADAYDRMVSDMGGAHRSASVSAEEMRNFARDSRYG